MVKNNKRLVRNIIYAIIIAISIVILWFIVDYLIVGGTLIAPTAAEFWDVKTKDRNTITILDWLDLFLIPITLTIAGFWFTRVQKTADLEIAAKRRKEDGAIAEEENETDREIALERQRQATLENYFDKISDLLINHELQITDDNSTRNIARARTFNVLRELDTNRQNQITNFLRETRLSYGEKSLFIEASLNKAELSGINLLVANLSSANLNYANLNDSNLHVANLSRANLYKADLSGADLTAANLTHTNLCEADLIETELVDANLTNADLSDADLSGSWLVAANLTGANLTGANLTDAILDSNSLMAFHPPPKLTNATMPDGSKYEEWITSQAPESQPRLEDSLNDEELLEQDIEDNEIKGESTG